MESVSLEDLEEVDLLLTGLEISRGRGNLILCSVASPAYRDRVIAAVAARFPSRVLAVETGDKLISDLRNAKAEKEEILIWTLPERLSDDILDALNNFRELFYDAGVPSLVFITPAGIDEIIWKAPDFWRYRGGYHILKGEEKGMGFQALGALSIPLDFSYKDKKELLRRKRINEHLLGRMQNKKEKANILSELGTISYLLSEPRKAIEFDDQALAISREIGDRRGEGNALRKLGNAYSELGEPRKAIEFHEQAMKISREIGDRRGEDPNNLGNAHYQLGELHKAIEFYEQALAIAREIGDLRSEGNALGNLGNAHYKLSEPRKAIEFYEQALKILREIGYRRGEGNALDNLGNAHYQLGELHKAIEFYEQALAIAREIGNRRGEGTALWNMSLALNSLGSRAKAIECARAALKIYEEIEDQSAKQVRQKLQKWESG
ncbi:MAG TPA: tetratricopeptide repeat protein [Methanothrix sp.]|nr:tetratricopeptide repeat protein [Methanothrix sp.]